MVHHIWLASFVFIAQVPIPAPTTGLTNELRQAEKAIQKTEAGELEAIANHLTGEGKEAEAKEAAGLIRLARNDDVTRLTPLPEVVPPSPKGLASVDSSAKSASGWRAEAEAIRKKSAEAFFDLARRAASEKSPSYELAGRCLRAVIERQPNHAEARRLLGYVPHEGGWAKPFAVRQLKEGKVNHPVYGWVPEDWVFHLELGELPGTSLRQGKTQWLPADQANEQRSYWKNPWRITTEHFELQSDAPLGEAIGFARRLEAFHDLFFAVMADAIGENLPLARRFRSASLTGEANYRPHKVAYFATKSEYVDHLKPVTGVEIEQSLGYFNPPKAGKTGRSTAYFFRDLDGQLPVTATLYHEVSHQLLFESAGPHSYTKNVGNYWVFEGLGTYFETVTSQPDGSLEVGGMVGERLEAARKSFKTGQFEPLPMFLMLDQNEFNRDDRIHVHYQQAMALAVFLLQWNDGVYREGFLDYVKDAYRGRIKQNSGRSLEDRLGIPINEIDVQFRKFLADEDKPPHP